MITFEFGSSFELIKKEITKILGKSKHFTDYILLEVLETQRKDKDGAKIN